MQNTKSHRVRLIALAISSLISFSAIATESTGSVIENGEDTDCKSVVSIIDGSFSIGYDSNFYDKDDYRSERNLSWDLSLQLPLSEQYKLYLATGAYRALEDETGDFWNDTIIGLTRYSILSFGETGSVDIAGQFTIPTSETSRKDDLITAFRIAMPVSIEYGNTNLSMTPRIRKNFHRYKTAGGRSLTEWIYGISLAADYSADKFSAGLSALAGNTISYQGTRRDSFDYGTSAYVAYQFTDIVSGALGISSSGFYTDAERGNLGDLELFDADKAVYNATISFSF
ncbi:hypothetical protein MD588_18400 [Photobacterium sp. SDRW27]|uniref:hypothetical protein n=1 Tax=Photobacterium obscurum TaxID=2829490 RepID=UPI00224332D6|nr:hypothetical protein [Photobacterium obscurum]MCW8330765.1 hypothetical protein [Photobacterium obscurum]